MAVLERAVAAQPGTPRVFSRPEQNAGMFLTHRLRSASGYDPSMPPARVRRLIDEINAGTRAHGLVVHVARAPRLAALLGIGIVTAPAGPDVRRLEAVGFRPIATLPPGDVVLHRAPVPRARLVREIVTASGEDATIARLRDPAHDLVSAVILDPADAATLGAIAEPAASDTVRIVDDAPERLVLATQTRGPALAVVTDAYYPGWVATVDGRPAPILRADHAFRAVAVPAGEHRIEMRYMPASLRLGALVSGLGALVAGAMLLAGRGSTRR
jgi:hypothetical protein